MGESTEHVVHLAGKVKNGVAMPLCRRATAGDVVRDDPDRATCARCLDAARADRDAAERWYRDQGDHYGETL
ncbi:hypothetical protein [Nocardiopsis trehalosi]|jgi:hypothetical protein|uniref:hypothetical protein n=1 Tax=Nocardiopsis trehalosi TaxID=109329 RepID=UPI00083221D3|nr:hypothetical protein [Nocardiopsis trehalosi]